MGFIKLDRKILKWEWWHDINTYRLFSYMLLAAWWKPGKHKGKDISRGSFPSSLNELSKETDLTENELRTAIKHLKITGEITSKSYNKFTVFTVKNYDLYQSDNEQNCIESTVEITSKSQTDNKQLTDKSRAINEQITNFPIIKESKKEISEEEKKERTEEVTPPISPSQEEVDEPKTKTKSKKKESPEDNVHMLNRLFADYCFSDFLLEKVQEWIEYKVARKETYVERGMKSLLTIIYGNAQKYGDMAVADVIDLSMSSNYKGILWDKISRKNNQQSFGNGGIDWSKV